MDKRSERRKKVIRLVKDLALAEIEKENKIPEAVSEYILGDYGLGGKSSRSEVSADGIEDFADKLEEFIKERRAAESTRPRVDDSRPNPLRDFARACETYRKTKSEYLDVARKLASLLEEIVRFRVEYSGRVRREAVAKLEEWECLEEKLSFLKSETLFDFYRDQNQFEAHLQLREVLTKRLTALEFEYNELVDRESRYNELKNNKTYCELLQKYKDLLLMEEKIDSLISN